MVVGAFQLMALMVMRRFPLRAGGLRECGIHLYQCRVRDQQQRQKVCRAFHIVPLVTG